MPRFKVGDKVKLKDDIASRCELPDTVATVIEAGDELGIQTEYKIKHDGLLPCVAFEQDLEPFPDLVFEPEGMTVDGKFYKNELTVSILGTTYKITEKPLKDCDGYCDKTTKEIAVATKDDDCDLGNFEEYRKKVLRHEIIHAYHHESGLAESFENKQYGFSETVVDWFAIQSPKIFKTFEELDIL